MLDLGGRDRRLSGQDSSPDFELVSVLGRRRFHGGGGGGMCRCEGIDDDATF